MTTTTRLLCLLTAVLVASAAPVSAQYVTGWGIQPAQPSQTPPPPRWRPDYEFSQVIQRVIGMPMDSSLQSRVQTRGFNVVNVMWEDTGRFQGSAVGPNISDLTLQVREPLGNGQLRTHLLPVIRHPNFSDRTADIPANRLWVRVGNHRRGGTNDLATVPLTEVLANLREYLTDPSSLAGSGDFLARRDSHFLVSAQAVFLPIPSTGRVEFNPVLYNYQSTPDSPAVLVLMITRHGTSATVIENRPGDQSMQGWGQQLFFNDGGMRTAFTAERRSTVAARIAVQGEHGQDRGALEEGADMVMIVQVPLVHARPRYESYGEGAVGGLAAPSAAPVAEAEQSMADGMPARRSTGAVRERSDVERAVIGFSEAMGPFREMGGHRLVRDQRFPIRVTVQFYKATSNGVVSDADLAAVTSDIDRVYRDADYVGSLVVPERPWLQRPTEWQRNRFPRAYPRPTSWVDRVRPYFGF